MGQYHQVSDKYLPNYIAEFVFKYNNRKDDKIGTFKRMMADAIDFLNDLSQQSEDGEAKRCFSIAMTELETAQMYGVKGIAKGIKK